MLFSTTAWESKLSQFGGKCSWVQCPGPYFEPKFSSLDKPLIPGDLAEIQSLTKGQRDAMIAALSAEIGRQDSDVTLQVGLKLL